VIQETSYDGRADIWSLGITLIELVEGQPPHYNVHPMRAIFMIPMKPAPTFKGPHSWSPEMENFLSRCLQKNPDQRANSDDLMQHPWIKDDIEDIQARGYSPVLKEFFLNSIEALQKIRSGEEDPQQGTEGEEKVWRVCVCVCKELEIKHIGYFHRERGGERLLQPLLSLILVSYVVCNVSRVVCVCVHVVRLRKIKLSKETPHRGPLKLFGKRRKPVRSR
jgi:serine/threonine protein kinase